VPCVLAGPAWRLSWDRLGVPWAGRQGSNSGAGRQFHKNTSNKLCLALQRKGRRARQFLELCGELFGALLRSSQGPVVMGTRSAPHERTPPTPLALASPGLPTASGGPTGSGMCCLISVSGQQPDDLAIRQRHLRRAAGSRPWTSGQRSTSRPRRRRTRGTLNGIAPRTTAWRRSCGASTSPTRCARVAGRLRHLSTLLQPRLLRCPAAAGAQSAAARGRAQHRPLPALGAPGEPSGALRPARLLQPP
jgi:hypothetical protein